MALVRQCDRCGKTYSQHEGANNTNKRTCIVTARLKGYSDTAFDYFPGDVKSLCPDCMESFYKWFKEV